MASSTAPSARPGRRRRGAPRPAVVVIALASIVVALVVQVVVVPRQQHRARLAADLPQALNAHPPIPVSEPAAATCFAAAPIVAAVRTDGQDVLVRFSGRSASMRIRFLADENAAIRASFAQGSESNFYNNTMWFGAPAALTQGERDTLSGCLPLDRAHA